MEMTPEALEFLADQAVKAAGPHAPITVLDAVDADKGYQPTIIMAPGQKLESVEHLYPGRCRFRGTLKTASIADYVGYVKQRTGDAADVVDIRPPGAVHASAVGVDVETASLVEIPTPPHRRIPVFIDADHMASTAFFNLGSPLAPGHGDDKAVLTIVKTAPFKALSELVRAPGGVDQRAFAEFLEDWRDFITPFTGYDDKGQGIATTVFKAVNAVRKVTIEALSKSEAAVGDLSESRSSLASIEAKATDPLPVAFRFTCTPYDGLREFDVLARIAIGTGEKPRFVVRLVRGEELVEHIAQDFKRVLEEGLGSSASLTVGVFTP